MYCWLAGAWLLPAAALAATWSVRDAPDGTVAKPRAVIVNSAGDELALFSDADGTVHLRFTIATAIVSLSRSSCPTFQIDRRLPLHHFAIDQACHIEHKTALIDLGQTQNLATPTVAIEQMMNGVQVAFRYTTADGAYHEADFPLAHSAGAIRRALGLRARAR